MQVVLLVDVPPPLKEAWLFLGHYYLGTGWTMLDFAFHVRFGRFTVVDVTHIGTSWSFIFSTPGTRIS